MVVRVSSSSEVPLSFIPVTGLSPLLLNRRSSRRSVGYFDRGLTSFNTRFERSFKQSLSPSTQVTMSTTSPGISRRTIPFLLDMVTVSDPALIRKIVSSPDIVRPAQGELPFLFKLVFSATQFYSPVTNAFPLVFTSDNADYQTERRQRVIDNLAKGFTEQELAQLSALVQSDRTEKEMGREVAKIMVPITMPLKDGEAVTEDMLQAMADMDPLTISSPPGYLKARSGRRNMEDIIAQKVPDDKYRADALHDTVTSYYGFSAGLQRLRTVGEGMSLEKHLAENPILPATFRVPSKTTTMDGIFDKPLVKDRTVITLDLIAAANVTKDLSFVFGAGIETRRCPFENLFMSTADRILGRTATEEKLD